MSSSSPTRRHLSSVPEDTLGIELERRRSLRLHHHPHPHHRQQQQPQQQQQRRQPPQPRNDSHPLVSDKGDQVDWTRSLISDPRMIIGGSSTHSSPSKKGKERERATDDVRRRRRPQQQLQQQQQQQQQQHDKGGKTEVVDWVVDLDRVSNGLERWSEKDRVIVVLGDPTSSALRIILDNPTFSSTLLLIQSLSTSSPISDGISDGTSYPTIQHLNIPPEHSSHHIVVAAADAAKRWRNRKVGTNNTNINTNKPSMDRSRRGSEVSMSSSSLVARPKSMSRPKSMTSLKGYMSRSVSATSVDRLQDRKGFTTAPSSSPSSSSSISSSIDISSPIDAVFHFLPSPEKATFQAMLQGSVMITTAVLPVMNRQGMRDDGGDGRRSSSFDFEKVERDDDTIGPIIIHVLPRGTPDQLPHVLDSFLSSLLPWSKRGMKGHIIPTNILIEPLKIGKEETQLTGLELVLSGGLYIPSRSMTSTIKPRAYFPTFTNCRFLGLSLATRPPPPPPPPPPPVTSSSSADSLPSLNVGYTDSNISPASTVSRSSDEIDLPTHGRLFDGSPRGSQSSTSSLPVTPMNGSRRSSFAPGVVEVEGDVGKVVVEKKRRWFGRLFTPLLTQQGLRPKTRRNNGH